MVNRLEGKVAVVTGSASGIGRACALALAIEGAQVYHTDIDAEGGAETDHQIAQADGTARFALHDVTDEARWDEIMADAADRFGPVNVLVNNAGIAIGGGILEFTLESWKKQMAVNTDSVFLGTRAGMRAMSQTGGGSIINISSVAGFRGSANLSAYCASKGAVRLFSRSAAVECARAGLNIRVNSVHPGIIDTAIWRKSIFEGEGQQQVLAALGAQEGANDVDPQIIGQMSCPMGRAGAPDEIAQTVVFLASDAATYTTGTELVVDGGMLA